MKVTQKLRRSLLLFLPALLLSTTVMTVLSNGNVFAADTSSGSFIATEVKDRVEKKNQYMFLRYCFDKSSTKGELSSSDVNGWDFFEYGSNKVGDKQTYYSIVGNIYGPNKDATLDCEDGNNIGDAFETLGFTDSRRTFCALDGAVLVKENRLGDDEYDDDEECYSKEVSGGYHWDINHDDQGKLRKSFEKLVGEAKPEVEGSGVNAWVTGGLQPHEDYVRYYLSFMEQCGVGGDDVEIEPGTYAAGDADADNKYMLTTVTQEGEEVDYLATGQVSSGSQVAIQAELGGSEYKQGDGEDAGNVSYDLWPRGKIVTCNTAVGDAGGLRKYSKAYADWLKANPQAEGETTVGDGAGTAEGSIGADCAGFSFKEALSLNWMLCPLIQGSISTANALEGQIAGMLCINETDIFAGADMTCDGEQGKSSSQKAFHNAWNVFRGLALGLLAIAGLLMIISQGLGFEIFDAYTIKKTLPRILVAAILISLSWPLLEAVVTFSNALGIGIRSLIYQPFIQSGIDTVVLEGGEAAVSAVLGIGGTVAAFALLGPIGILSFIATALIAIIIAFFVLVIRNILVILLVIIAPIAIAMYILPNTEKWAKVWWDWLFKALLAFPIITAMIAIGHVFAAITSQKDGGLLTTIVAFIAYFAPYFLIPAAFRFAGGAIATIGGFANDRSRGSFDRLKRFRGEKVEKNAASMAAGNRMRGDGRFSRSFNKTTGNIAAFAKADKGINPAQWRSSVQASKSSHSLDEAAEYSEKNSAFQSIKGNDDLLTAALKHRGNEAGIRSFLAGKNYDSNSINQGVAAIRLARRDTSEEVFDTAAAMALPATGTAFSGGAGEMHDVINEVAGNDRQKASRMLAAMRGGAAGARRFDIAGGSYGSQLGALNAQYDGAMTSDEASRKVVEDSLNGQGGSYVAGARNGAVKNFAPVMRDQLDAVIASGDEIAINRELAKVAGKYDAMASVAPENAEVLANEVLGTTLKSASSTGKYSVPDGNGTSRVMTVREMIEDRRSNPDFLNMRREYGAAAASGAAQAAQAAQTAQLYGQQGPQGPVAPPPTGPVMGP